MKRICCFASCKYMLLKFHFIKLYISKIFSLAKFKTLSSNYILLLIDRILFIQSTAYDKALTKICRISYAAGKQKLISLKPKYYYLHELFCDLKYVDSVFC